MPGSADPKAAPQWKVVGRTGRFEFHDHRIHWMTKTDPPQVKDESQRTKVFDWKVPLRGGRRRRARSAATLFWRGTRTAARRSARSSRSGRSCCSAAPAVVVVRRRRAPAAREPRRGEPREEAW